MLCIGCLLIKLKEKSFEHKQESKKALRHNSQYSHLNSHDIRSLEYHLKSAVQSVVSSIFRVVQTPAPSILECFHPPKRNLLAATPSPSLRQQCASWWTAVLVEPALRALCRPHPRGDSACIFTGAPFSLVAGFPSVSYRVSDIYRL